jgi:START domain
MLPLMPVRAVPALVYAGLALALGLAASPAMADEAGWSRVVERDGIVVDARSVPGSSVDEVRAETEIAVAPTRVFAVLLDSDHFVEFMPYIVEASTVARETSSVWYLYQRISPPFVSDRDYTLRQKSSEDPQHGRYELQWEAANSRGPAARDGVVRVENCTGAYVVQGIDSGERTRLTYRLRTDPGGSIPKWLANQANRESVPALLQAIARRSADPGWRR